MSGNRSKSAFFEGGSVIVSADFRGKGMSPTNHCWCQSSRVIALSCGINISAVRHLVLSQSTRVTDGRTDGRTDGQNYDSQDCSRICSRGKNKLTPRTRNKRITLYRPITADNYSLFPSRFKVDLSRFFHVGLTQLSSK